MYICLLFFGFVPFFEESQLNRKLRLIFLIVAVINFFRTCCRLYVSRSKFYNTNNFVVMRIIRMVFVIKKARKLVNAATYRDNKNQECVSKRCHFRLLQLIR